MWHTMPIDSVLRELRTNLDYGLSEEEAKKRLEQFGKNKLDEKKKTSIFIRFFLQFNDFMIIILLVAAGISAIMSYVENTNEYIDSVIIVAIVVFNAMMGLIQESKAEKSLEALASMSAPLAKVKREGKIKEIQSDFVVPGDIVILETGNFVPADARLAKTYNLSIEESALTRRSKSELIKNHQKY